MNWRWAASGDLKRFVPVSDRPKMEIGRMKKWHTERPMIGFTRVAGADQTGDEPLFPPGAALARSLRQRLLDQRSHAPASQFRS